MSSLLLELVTIATISGDEQKRRIEAKLFPFLFVG